MIRQKHRSTLPRCFSGFARRNIPDSLLYDLTHDLARTGSGIGLIGINVHSQCIRIAYTYYNITEYQTSSLGIDLNRNHLSVLNAKSLCICLGGMDMTLRGNNAFRNLDLTLRPYNLAGSASPNISRLSTTKSYTRWLLNSSDSRKWNCTDAKSFSQPARFPNWTCFRRNPSSRRTN